MGTKLLIFNVLFMLVHLEQLKCMYLLRCVCINIMYLLPLPIQRKHQKVFVYFDRTLSERYIERLAEE